MPSPPLNGILPIALVGLNQQTELKVCCLTDGLSIQPDDIPVWAKDNNLVDLEVAQDAMQCTVKAKGSVGFCLVTATMTIQSTQFQKSFRVIVKDQDFLSGLQGVVGPSCNIPSTTTPAPPSILFRAKPPMPGVKKS